MSAALVEHSPAYYANRDPRITHAVLEYLPVPDLVRLIVAYLPIHVFDESAIIPVAGSEIFGSPHLLRYVSPLVSSTGRVQLLLQSVRESSIVVPESERWRRYTYGGEPHVWWRPLARGVWVTGARITAAESIEKMGGTVHWTITVSEITAKPVVAAAGALARDNKSDTKTTAGADSAEPHPSAVAACYSSIDVVLGVSPLPGAWNKWAEVHPLESCAAQRFSALRAGDRVGMSIQTGAKADVTFYVCRLIAAARTARECSSASAATAQPSFRADEYDIEIRPAGFVISDLAVGCRPYIEVMRHIPDGLLHNKQTERKGWVFSYDEPPSAPATFQCTIDVDCWSIPPAGEAGTLIETSAKPGFWSALHDPDSGPRSRYGWNTPARLRYVREWAFRTEEPVDLKTERLKILHRCRRHVAIGFIVLALLLLVAWCIPADDPRAALPDYSKRDRVIDNATHDIPTLRRYLNST